MELNSIDAVIGFFVPPAVSWLSKQSWPGAYKTLAAFGIAVLIAIIRVYLNGQFSLEDWGGTIFLVMGVAQTSYVTFWKPIGAAKKLEASGPIKNNPVLVSTTPDVKLPTGYDPDNEAGLNG